MASHRDSWIGAGPTTPQLAIVLVSCAFAIVMTTSLQPILLGGLLTEQRLTLAQLGQTASVELLAMAVTCSVAGAFFQPNGLRLKAGLTGLGLVAANLLTMAASDQYVMLARALSGGGCGIYLWIVTCMLVRSHNAARYAGVVTLIQSAMAVVLSYVLGALSTTPFGANGGYACLALLSAFLTAAFCFFPSSFEPIAGQEARKMPPKRGFAALVVVLLYTAGLIGAWVYVGAMTRQLGYVPAQTATTVSIALVAQLMGALAASVLGNRVNAVAAIIFGTLGEFALVLAMTHGSPVLLFQTVIALFAMVWTFSVPFLLPMAIEVDSSRTSALYVFTVQSVGAAAGPALCAFLIRGDDVQAALLGAAALILAASALLLLVRLFFNGRPTQTA